MPFTPPWDETDPDPGEPIASGAQEIQDTKSAVRLRLDTILTDGAAPTIPTTFADLDTSFSTDVTPMRVRGENVDLRGMTWRLHGPVTNGILNAANPTTFANIPSLELSISTVSTLSLLYFKLDVQLSTIAPANNDFAGSIRVFNTTDATALAPVIDIRHIASASPEVGTTWHSLSFGPITGISNAAARVFDVQALKNGSSSVTFNLNGQDQQIRFYCIEHP